MQNLILFVEMRHLEDRGRRRIEIFEDSGWLKNGGVEKRGRQTSKKNSESYINW